MNIFLNQGLQQTVAPWQRCPRQARPWAPSGGAGRQAHHEVEMLGFLLVSTSLGNAGFTQVGFRHGGLDGLRGPAVLETLRHIVVFDSDHVLDGLEGGFGRFLDLGTGKHFSH